MNEVEFKALQNVLTYMIPAEKKHYKESREPKEHIYIDLMTLQRWEESMEIEEEPESY